jgi:nucleoid-associated protein YgaU
MGILDKLFDRKRDNNSSVVKSGKPDFSNVVAGSSSAPETTPAPAPAAGRTYVVVKGDTLSQIAEREYGDASRWREIYQANRATIKNPNLIYPGQKLRLP